MQHFCSDKWTFEMRTSCRERIPHLQLIRDLSLRKLHSSCFWRASCSKIFLGAILPSFYNLLMTTQATRLVACSLKYHCPFYFCEKIEKLWRNINIPITWNTYYLYTVRNGIWDRNYTFHIIFYIFSINYILFSTKKTHDRLILFTTKSMRESELKSN